MAQGRHRAACAPRAPGPAGGARRRADEAERPNPTDRTTRAACGCMPGRHYAGGDGFIDARVTGIAVPVRGRNARPVAAIGVVVPVGEARRPMQPCWPGRGIRRVPSPAPTGASLARTPRHLHARAGHRTDRGLPGCLRRIAEMRAAAHPPPGGRAGQTVARTAMPPRARTARRHEARPDHQGVAVTDPATPAVQHVPDRQRHEVEADGRTGVTTTTIMATSRSSIPPPGSPGNSPDGPARPGWCTTP